MAEGTTCRMGVPNHDIFSRASPVPRAKPFYPSPFRSRDCNDRPESENGKQTTIGRGPRERTCEIWRSCITAFAYECYTPSLSLHRFAVHRGEYNVMEPGAFRWQPDGFRANCGITNEVIGDCIGMFEKPRRVVRKWSISTTPTGLKMHERNGQKLAEFPAEAGESEISQAYMEIERLAIQQRDGTSRWMRLQRRPGMDESVHGNGWQGWRGMRGPNGKILRAGISDDSGFSLRRARAGERRGDYACGTSLREDGK